MPDPLSPASWRRLLDFLGLGKTGQVVLHVHEGRVTKLELRETFANHPEPVVDSPAK